MDKENFGDWMLATGILLSLSENSDDKLIDNDGELGTGGTRGDVFPKLLKLALPGMCNPNPQVDDEPSVVMFGVADDESVS